MIIALVVLLIGAVVLFLVKPGQGNQPIVTGNTPTVSNQPTTIPGSGTTPTSASTDIPTATPFPNATPSPTPTAQTAALPCIVDVGTWTNGSSDWKVLNGVLLNDGTILNGSGNNGGPTIVAPCQLGDTANYAVETKVQVIKVVRYPCFGITVRGNPISNGWQGYTAGIGGCNSPDSSFVGKTYLGDSQAAFDPGSTLHTYRVEARDNTIKFFIDGGLILNITDNRYLSGSEVGLYCYGVQLQVTSFKVTAL